jgi:MFS family permease
MAGFRIGFYAGMSLISAAFSSLLAYRILQTNSSKYEGWQALFILEGGLTLLVASGHPGRQTNESSIRVHVE